MENATTSYSLFIERLRKKTFLNGEEIAEFLDPEIFTKDYLIKNGFVNPVIFKTKNPPGLKVPPYNDWMDLEQFVGAETEIIVNNCEDQSCSTMNFGDFLKYMNNPQRSVILNSLSLECSNNGLDQFIKAPIVARELDFIEKFWPIDNKLSKPKLQKYCLLSPKNAYTDFHIDFAGSSVWYHIVKGTKIFYIIKPVENNRYWKWNNSTRKLNEFFGDKVLECFRFTMKAGDTLLLPSGFIHAVLTEEDSIVYGGNFLHELSLEYQLKIYDMEVKYKTPKQYMFPSFKDLHWLVGKGLLTELENLNGKQIPAPKYLLNGLKVLTHYLEKWLPSKRMFIKQLHEAKNLIQNLREQILISEKLVQNENTLEPKQSKRKRKAHQDPNYIYF